MGFLDWIKRRERDRVPSENKPDDVGRKHTISPIWQPAPYKAHSSGYLVQPCVGWSEKGYHPGLVTKAPGAEPKTQWGAATPTYKRALAESHSAFAGWLESHEAEMDNARRSGTARRRGPSMER